MTDSSCLGPAPDMDHPPDPSALDPDDQALQHLINRAVPQSELASLIETIFSNKKVADVVDYFQGADAQTFIDVIDEVWRRTLLPLRHQLTYSNILRSAG